MAAGVDREDLDPLTKLEIYKLVLLRYKNLITEKESISISEVRQKVSPYGTFIQQLNSKLLSDIVPYEYRLHFFMAAEKAIAYVRQIHTCEFSFTFWLDFEDIVRLKVATALDKAILLAALLRSFGSDTVKVVVTKKGKAFVRFSWNDTQYVVSSETGSLLSGDDSLGRFTDDPVAYAFNDLVYENYDDA